MYVNFKRVVSQYNIKIWFLLLKEHIPGGTSHYLETSVLALSLLGSKISHFSYKVTLCIILSLFPNPFSLDRSGLYFCLRRGKSVYELGTLIGQRERGGEGAWE